MPTEIKFNAVVTMSDNKVPWRICHKDMQLVNGQRFVVIQPSAYSFVRVISAGSEFATTINGTLANSEAILKLKKLRNDASLTIASGGAKLFSNAIEPDATVSPKKRRTSRSDAARTRQSPLIVTVPVPSTFNDKPALDVQMLMAVNESDNLIVQLDEDAIEHMMMFIRHASDLSQVEVTRPYGQTGRRGYFARRSKSGLMQEYEQLANGKVKRLFQPDVPNDNDGMASADDEVRNIAGELASASDELASADDA